MSPICNPIVPEILHGCPRCGGDHERLEFWELVHPREQHDGSWMTHWAPCPATGAPILMSVEGLNGGT